MHVSTDRRAATTSWNVAFDIGQKSSESFAKLEDIVDHYDDGNRRRHSSPVLSDGGIDEPGQIMILIGINNMSRSSDAEGAQSESMLVCLFTIVRQKFQCAVLTVCTTPMSTRTT